MMMRLQEIPTQCIIKFHLANQFPEQIFIYEFAQAVYCSSILIKSLKEKFQLQHFKDLFFKITRQATIDIAISVENV